MKIGTLTLHLPFNYGNALQMLSLHRYLLEQGYDAEVLSHWYFKDRDEVLFIHNRFRRLKGFLHNLLDIMTFGGFFMQYRREAKLDRWLFDNIAWSEERGPTGDFNPDKLPHEVVVVGSDQVWNPIHRTSEFFLLGDFPDRIRKIAYAASMGSDQFLPEKIPLFSNRLKRFDAISVREASAKEIIENQLGGSATLVCDPTLLHTKEEWCKMLGFELPQEENDELVVYLVTPDHRRKWRDLIRLARTSGKKVHFFAFQWSQWLPSFDIWHPIQTIKLVGENICKRALMYLSGIRLHLSATPTEFVRCIAKSKGVITDSFHGMMFATIFEKECNVIVGEHSERRQMSARLKDFTRDFGDPGIITGRFDLNAMRRLRITPRLRTFINDSKAWLKAALGEAPES